jgi:hypothetical protein
MLKGLKRSWECVNTVPRKRGVSANLKKLKTEVNTIPKIENISAPIDANWNEWISATKTRNFMLNDPLCDWLEYQSKSAITQISGISTRSRESKNSTTKNESTNFTEFIMSQGIEFEKRILKLMIKKVGKDNIKKIHGEEGPRTIQKVRETLDAIRDGSPIIHSGVLHNPQNQTYGIPDLIIRSDWINKIVSTPVYTPEEESIKAQNLNGNYHYLIVDIKFTTLDLRSDGIHLLNSHSFPAYKSQLLIYNDALNIIQGYNPNKTFILGRKWKYTKNGIKYQGKSCFERLGIINYSTIDGCYIQKTQDAIEWIRDVRDPSSKDWNISKVPLERKELYPNMSNHHDYPWREAKETIASDIKEITSLWMMSVKNREMAHAKGIWSWTDKKCTVDTLGCSNVEGSFVRKTLREILKINKVEIKEGDSGVLPKKIVNNLDGWQTPAVIEFYVDFETVNDVITDFSELPLVENSNKELITMIGVGYIHPDEETWVYKNFTVNKLTLFEEALICKDFSNYIQEISEEWNVKNPKCIHWSPAECRFWEKSREKHFPKSRGWFQKWRWFDLLEVFKSEPIVVKGSLSFGLKSVSKALKNLGHIETGWESDSSCLDGQGAIIGAWKAHKLALKENISMKNTQLMRDISKYNESDVKVLYEIITYLRDYHI